MGRGGGVSLFSLTFGADLSVPLAKVWVEGVESGYESEVFTGRSQGSSRNIWLSFAVFEEVKYRRDSGRGGGVSLFSLTFGVD